MANIDKNIIEFLQDHFDARNRLVKARIALKCQTKDASIFFSYKDGWNNKQYVNLPVEAEDLITIIDGYLEGIDNDIMRTLNEGV